MLYDDFGYPLKTVQSSNKYSLILSMIVIDVKFWMNLFADDKCKKI